MKTVKLNNGVNMPIIGMGVFQISDEDQCKKTVLDALESGYRLIDTASSYKNEGAVGQAIYESNLLRDDIFITSKVWVSDSGYDRTMSAFEKTLEKMKLDYLDLYLIHQPYGDIYGTWRAMEELYESGKVRAIGVSNFHSDRLMDLILQHKIIPAVNQIEVHPFYQRSQEHEFLKLHNIQIESWASFAEGKNNLFKNTQLQIIGNKYGKSPAQVVLRWLVQRSVVVIPKSVNKERMIENIDVFNFELTDEDMNLIGLLEEGKSLFFDHRDPSTVKYISTLK